MTETTRRRRRPIVALVALAWLASSCGDPCLNLSEQVCLCEASEQAQHACIQRIQNQAGTQPATPQATQETCSTLLESCTCARLAQGDLAACGLARETDSTALRDPLR